MAAKEALVFVILIVFDQLFSFGLNLLHYFFLFIAFIAWTAQSSEKSKWESSTPGQLPVNYSTLDFDSLPSPPKTPHNEPAEPIPQIPIISHENGVNRKQKFFIGDSTSEAEATVAAAAAAMSDPSASNVIGLPKTNPEDDQDLMTLLRKIEGPTADWKVLLDKPAVAKVLRSNQSKFCFRVEAMFNNDPRFCFRVLTNERYWTMETLNLGSIPSLIKEVKEIDVLDPYTQVLYVQARGIWPVGARDIVMRFHKRILPDGRMVAIGKSVEHTSAPVIPGVTRIHAEVSGAIFGPMDAADPEKCWTKLIADADPKGWIPDNLVNFASSQIVPQILWLINKLIKPAKAGRKRKTSISRTNSGRLNGSITPSITPSSSANNLVRSQSESFPVIDPAASSELIETESGELRFQKKSRDVTPPSSSGGILGFIIKVLKLNEIRRALLWAKPFIITAIYFLVLYEFFRKRRSIAANQ